MRRACCRMTIAVLMLLGAAHVGAAQSLADLARQQEARRQQASAARKYTNTDLNVEQPAKKASPEQEPGAPSTPPEAGQRPVTIVENPETGTANVRTAPGVQDPDEAQWRRAARDLRGRLAKAQADIAAAESELAALAPGEDQETRQSTTATLTRRRNDVRLLSEELARFTIRAQAAKIPPEWTR